MKMLQTQQGQQIGEELGLVSKVSMVHGSSRVKLEVQKFGDRFGFV